MSLKNLVEIMLLALVFASCEHKICPQDKQVGTVEMQTNAKEFVPYTSNDTLQFLNEQAQLMQLFEIENIHNFHEKLCVKHLCTEPQFDGESSCEYVAAESKKWVFANASQDVVLDISLFPNIYTSDTIVMYYQFGITLSINEAVGMGNAVADAQNADSLLLVSQLPNPLLKVDTVVIKNELFQNVLQIQSPAIKLYYQVEKGLIGFEDGEHQWVLVN
ncbi:MAG: hypothetical protein R2798_01590 [Chitinophagales bacterium]|nr:hypothetical protein [Bacteroidota bacterium]MCB9042872.1 hypothetical protein [Chitinophagales bacterium]